MMYEKSKAEYDRISREWPEEARGFTAALLKAIHLLENRVKALEDQLSKNSRNSFKPPSQDVNRPVKRSGGEERLKRDAGGQQGHKGQGGKWKDNPDHIVSYTLGDCPECGQDLRPAEVEEIVRRQVEDIPPIKTVVTEYRMEVKTCPCYTTRWQDNFRRAAAKQLGSFMDGLRKNLSQAPAAYFDETGIRVGGVNHWVHVACSKVLSLFGIYRNRGKKAYEEMGVLSGFTGIAHRDAYRPYDDYAK